MSAEVPLVLVAEDDDDILALLRNRLEREGYDVATASDGERALALARERPPDLAVIDVTMPGIDGHELTRRLRADPRTSAIPIVILTAAVQEADVALSRAAGADEHVAKPFSPREFAQRIARLLARRAAD